MRSKEEIMAAIELYNKENKRIELIQIAGCIALVLALIVLQLSHADLGVYFLLNIVFMIAMWTQGFIWSDRRLRRKYVLCCTSCGWLFPSDTSFEDVLAPRLCQKCHQPLFKYD